jgi:lipopolysaccharide transport system ATP-binding protein
LRLGSFNGFFGKTSTGKALSPPMTDIAIRAENISKLYRIGVKEEIQDNFLATMLDFLRSPLKNFRKYRSLYRFQDVSPEMDNAPEDVVWALKNVSFEVKQSEVIGVIGMNGAGKSTLLKILSRITDPTRGRAEIRGRVSSLLEVGTGFHPELSGRENVFLNGTILGMRKREIDGKFDEIVEFSGISKFIDTPVKRYSSGMRVRLAFAVAAHLEPEILLVDEVLAVGDAAFQKKCLQKMEDVGQAGRTVFFVSHNMPSITRLCPRCILLNGGRVVADGPSHEVVNFYLNSGMRTPAEQRWEEIADAPGDWVVRLRRVAVRDHAGRVSDVLDIRRPVFLEMEYDVLEPDLIFMVYFRLWNEEGVELFDPIDNDPDWRRKPRPTGTYTSVARIPGNYLAEGTHFVGAAIRTLFPMARRFMERDTVAFQVVDSMDGDSARVDHAGALGGVVRPLLEWETRYAPPPGS